MRRILASHFVSPAAFYVLLKDPFSRQDFETFLEQRQHTIREAIVGLLEGSRLQSPVPLEGLDAQIKDTELGLRRLIAQDLNDDPAVLPDHVQQRIRERLQTAFRTTPAFDMKQYATLPSQLHFADLRELPPFSGSRNS